MTKDLSIIIPVHNKAPFLPKVTESFQNQQVKWDQVEIIFVADNCTDGSIALLEPLRTARGAKVIEVADGNGSAARARNIGIESASGKNYLFLDADIIIPPGFLASITQPTLLAEDTVNLIPIYGNSCALSIWPFLVKKHFDYASLSYNEMWNWAKSEELLKDLRLEFADSVTGSLDHLQAPWVFCWSAALLIGRHLFRKVGGFNNRLNKKGSEDLELGFRLFRTGALFRLVLDAYVFHQPHPRDRDLEERLDRMHEREMLKAYPCREMEALCAFDGGHANPMLDMLDMIGEDTVSALDEMLAQPVDMKRLGLPDKIQLSIGPTPPWLIEAIRLEYVVYPWANDDYHVLPLFGLSLPFEDGSFDSAVVMGVWELFPERLSCRILDEALRVASDVYIIKRIDHDIPKPIWSEDIIALNDNPYWERTHRLRRSFYDFRAEPCGQYPPYSLYYVRRSVAVQV